MPRSFSLALGFALAWLLLLALLPEPTAPHMLLPVALFPLVGWLAAAKPEIPSAASPAGSGPDDHPHWQPRLTTVFEAARDVSFIITDLNGTEARVLEYSPGAERLFGWSRAEMLGQPVARLHRPEDVARFPEALAAMAESRSGFSGEAELVRKGGERFDALFTSYPLLDQEGRMVAALGVSVDISAQKRFAQELRVRNSELEAVLANMHMLVAVLDAEFNFVRVNDAYANVAGHSPEELIGTNHFDRYPDPENERIFRQVVESGETYSVAARPFRNPEFPGQGTSWWNWTLAPLKNAEGAVTGLVLTLVDVTERERAVQALCTSEERFALALKAANDGLWDLDVRTGRTWHSPRWKEIFGLEDKPDPTFDDWRSRVHPEDLVRLDQVLKQVWEGDIVSREECYRIRTASGEERWVLDRFMVVRGGDGSPIRLVGTNMDITARKRAEAETESVSRLYAVLSEANKAMVRRPDRTSLLEAVCRALVEQGGLRMVWIGVRDGSRIVPELSYGAIDGYLDGLVIDLDHPLQSQGPAASALREDRPVVANDIAEAPSMVTWREPALARNYRSVAVFPLREGGIPFGVLAAYADSVGFFNEARRQLLASLAEDICFALDSLEERQRREAAEAALHRAHDELEQRVAARTAALLKANQELEAFSYSISHDLRSPLRAVNGFCGLLLEDYGSGLDPKARQYLHRATDASARMDQMIDGLLMLSQVARVEVRRAVVDLVPLARQVINELRHEAPERAVELVLPASLEVNADPQLARLLLDNLLGNAWKFTRDVSPSRIEMGRRECHGEATAYVRDNGIGFDTSYGDTLFGVFQRGHAAGGFPGTGIGLATVDRIIRAHQGRIWADSRVGEGATFCFTFEPHEDSRATVTKGCCDIADAGIADTNECSA